MGAVDPRNNLIGFHAARERSKTIAEHKELLSQYLEVARYLSPSGDRRFHRSTFWHRYISFDKIFTSEEALRKGHIEITSVINWKHLQTSPRYLQLQLPDLRFHRFMPAVNLSKEAPRSMTKADLAYMHRGFEYTVLRQAYKDISISLNLTGGSSFNTTAALNSFGVSGVSWDGNYCWVRFLATSRFC